jgi:hypothetical protein
MADKQRFLMAANSTLIVVMQNGVTGPNWPDNTNRLDGTEFQ